MAKNPTDVQRGLKLGDEGRDVIRLQHNLNRQADHWNLPFLKVKADGKFGPRSLKSSTLILYALGVWGRPIKRARNQEVLSQYAQRLIRGTRPRIPSFRAVSWKRRPTLRKWRRNAKAKGTPEKIRDVINEVDRLVKLRLPYVFGGGHWTPAPVNGPFDCSSFASRLWQMLEPGLSTGTTYTLAEEGVEGEGDYFTLFINNVPGRPDWSHVIVRIKDGNTYRWCQCGGRDNPAPGGGPSWFHPTPARIQEFQTRRHPKGY